MVRHWASMIIVCSEGKCIRVVCFDTSFGVQSDFCEETRDKIRLSDRHIQKSRINLNPLRDVESDVEFVHFFYTPCRGEPIIGKTSVKPINRLVFSQSAIGRLSSNIGMVSGVGQEWWNFKSLVWKRWLKVEHCFYFVADGLQFVFTCLLFFNLFQYSSL